MHKFQILAVAAGIAVFVLLAYAILRRPKNDDTKDDDVPDDRYPLW
ncbi:MAG: hypothetical protein V1682_05285 [Candidatus Omnitrophota bacterium]